LSDIIEIEIYQIEIIERGVRDKDYLFYLRGSDRPIPMTSKEVLSPALFTEAVFSLTKKPPNLLAYAYKKKHIWLQAVGNAMAEATVIKTGEDETSDSLIIEVISEELRDPEDDLRVLDSRVVIQGGTIYLKIRAIRALIRLMNEKVPSPREVGMSLRRLGFKNERKSTPGIRHQVRLWFLPYSEWRWKPFRDGEEQGELFEEEVS